MVEGSSSVGYYSSLLILVDSKAFSNIVPEDKSTWENLTFPDAASTYDFYKRYATQAGFVVRKHWHSCKDSTKKKIDIPFYLHYSCNKRGFKKGSALDPSNDFEVDSVEDDRSYKIISWNAEYCYPLHPKEQSHLLHPKINPIQVVVVLVNVEAGILNRSLFELFSRMAGGVEKVGFRPIDLRQLKLEDGEGSSLLEYFRLESLNKPNYLYYVQFDSEEQAASIIWSDRIMRYDYACFGDVLNFDTTFRTNNLYRPLDQCQAIYAAVVSVMPSTVLDCLCSWHITENAKKNLGCYADTKFIDELHFLIEQIDSPREFDFNWDKMVAKCFSRKDVDQIKWLSFVRGYKEQWCSAWVKSHFIVGLKSTS
ncbi:hypothetical protein LIER_00847 [Lithospermum erythrorhizon]|uniref:Protein FAR1-RELATED SEQUENCE n=1 Tax=Lithospermum erythrorhizon TaxID=34254 RepID=A0AAV3NMH0_LITER